MKVTPLNGPKFDRRSILGALGVSALLGGQSATALARTMAQNRPTFSGLTKIINDYVEQKKVAGMLAAIGYRNEAPTVISAGTLTLGGEKPVGLNDTLWRMYSQTKPVTGMATMMLIEDGDIDLDQPVSEILPAFKDMQVLVDPEGPVENTVAAKGPITIRQLQTHTAGLGYTIVSKGPIQKAYLKAGLTPGRVSRNPIPGVDPGSPTPDLATFIERLGELPLVYQPGSKWSYSLSHDVLSAVIEKVSGKPAGPVPAGAHVRTARHERHVLQGAGRPGRRSGRQLRPLCRFADPDRPRRDEHLPGCPRFCVRKYRTGRDRSRL